MEVIVIGSHDDLALRDAAKKLSLKTGMSETEIIAKLKEVLRPNIDHVLQKEKYMEMVKKEINVSYSEACFEAKAKPHNNKHYQRHCKRSKW